jgi:hypothetical protein
LNGSSSDEHDAIASIPSYKVFVHRFTVVSLYRNFLKTIRSLPKDAQTDLIRQVQQEFHTNKQDNDPFNVQRALAEGQRRFQELISLVPPSSKKASLQDSDSWLNTKDAVDPRGRVGEGWPWHSN